MQPVKTGKRCLEDYREIISPQLYSGILERAGLLRGLRIAQFNATSSGGGVAELLYSMVPLMNDLGINTEWYVIPPREDFFEVTKKIHNALQGDERSLTEAEKEIYLSYNKEISGMIEGINPDLWLIHDPQPAAALSFLPKRCPAVWRCHLDTYSPNPEMWSFIRNFLDNYDAYVFSLDEFVPEELRGEGSYVIPPAIDPLDVKNQMMGRKEAEGILGKLGIDAERPLVTQVSRFDPWKDPIGVVKAYELAREEIPDLQLALMGLITANDDPEAVEIFGQVEEYCAGKGGVHLFADPGKITVENDPVVSVLQSYSDVVMQKSIREGFGLTVAQGMWKYKPVVGGNVGGIKLQIDDGINGFLVGSEEEAARRIVDLMRDCEMEKEMGKAAHQKVGENFLIPHLLYNWLGVVEKVVL